MRHACQRVSKGAKGVKERGGDEVCQRAQQHMCRCKDGSMYNTGNHNGPDAADATDGTGALPLLPQPMLLMMNLWQLLSQCPAFQCSWVDSKHKATSKPAAATFD